MKQVNGSYDVLGVIKDSLRRYTRRQIAVLAPENKVIPELPNLVRKFTYSSRFQSVDEVSRISKEEGVKLLIVITE